MFLFWLRPQLQNLNPQNEVSTHTNYIIRFNLRKNIKRDNPAAKYPTDFGVLWIEESGREAVVGEIERLAMVKDVSVEFRYQRVLLGGSFRDGEKLPGKIFTSMSFEGGADHSSNATSSRRLLAQVREIVKVILLSAFFVCSLNATIIVYHS